MRNSVDRKLTTLLCNFGVKKKSREPDPNNKEQRRHKITQRAEV